MRTGSSSASFTGSGQPLLPVRHGRRIHQRQLQGAQQPDGHHGARGGISTAAVRKIRQADRLQLAACMPTTRPPIPSPGLALSSPGTTLLFGTPGASNSLMNQHQWGFAPRIGVAWTPTSKLTVRAGAEFITIAASCSATFAQRGRRLQRSFRRNTRAAFCIARFRAVTARPSQRPVWHDCGARPRRQPCRVPGSAAQHRPDRNRQVSRRATCLVRSCTAVTISTTSCPYSENWTSDFSISHQQPGCSA